MLPVAENDLPWRALDYAHRHLGATRDFSHGVGAALIVADLRLGADAVAAALLHGCPGGSPEFAAEFGNAAALAHGVAAMAHIEALATSSTDKSVDPHAQIESLRQMVLAMVQDVRAVLVKLAERTHALRCAARQDDATCRATRQAGARSVCATGQSSGRVADQVGDGRLDMPLSGARHLQAHRRAAG